MGIWGGKAGKAGKQIAPTPVPDNGVRGAVSPGNAVPAPHWQYGANPIAFSFAHRLGVASSLTSPMVAGRFRPLESGDPTRRGGTPDFGALQHFRGLTGLTGKARVGMQGGPSAQPAYPSTGQGGITNLLAGMSQPDVDRVWF